MYKMLKTSLNAFTLLFVIIFSFSLTAQEKPDQNSDYNKFLYIYSDPSNASVFIDDSLCGKTPLRINGFRKHRYEIKLIDESGRQWKINTAAAFRHPNSIYALIGKNHGLLKISTVPDSASIFINNIYQGKTPSGHLEVPLGYSRIRITRDGYKDYEGDIFIDRESAQLFDYSFNLKSIYSRLDISALPPESDIFIDNKLVNKGNVVELLSGEHNIETVRNGRVVDKDFSVLSDTLYKVFLSKERFTFRPLFTSMFLPGIGQFSSGAKIKGIGIFAGTMGLAAASYIASSDYTQKADIYNKRRADYLAANDELAAILTKKAADEAENQKNKALNNKRLLLGLFAAAYLYNIADVLLFHSFRESLEIKKLSYGFELYGNRQPGSGGVMFRTSYNF